MALSIVLCLVLGRAYPEGPPPAHTGGFGEPTCHFCHFDGTPNEGGILELRGLEEFYTPGASYELEVVLSKAEMARAGFQLSARFANGNLMGKQAGAVFSEGERLAVDTLKKVEYIRHTKPGTELADSALAVWHFKWEAPAEREPVVFHVAANAANGDDSEFGDSIYFISKEVSVEK